MDNHTKEQRHTNMCHIRANSKPEQIVRSYLFSKGFRFRKNDKRYPGQPDIVLPKYKIVIFVNGCFWHQHPGCKYASVPKSNKEYWIPKLNKNAANDSKNIAMLEEMGWKVITIWECALKPDKCAETAEKLYKQIISNNIT